MEEEVEEEYVVEAIRGWRYNLQRKAKEFHIKWLNYGEDENTWEPEEHLQCPDLLEDYISKLSDDELKYFHSSQPHKLHGFQRHATFVRCLGADGPHDSDSESSTKINKQKFYCLLKFEDCESAEEVTLNEFFKHHPKAAFNFIERRIISKNREISPDE